MCDAVTGSRVYPANEGKSEGASLRSGTDRGLSASACSSTARGRPVGGSRREPCARTGELGAGAKGSAKGRGRERRRSRPRGGDPGLRRGCPSLQRKDKVYQHPPARPARRAPAGCAGANPRIFKSSSSFRGPSPRCHHSPTEPRSRGKAKPGARRGLGAPGFLGEAWQALVSAKFPEPRLPGLRRAAVGCRSPVAADLISSARRQKPSSPLGSAPGVQSLL